MQIPFFKYQATGNDFVMIDNREGKYHLSEKQVAFLCNRHFGVGSDGLIFLESIAGQTNDNTPLAFRMSFYNPDGTSGMMCGNGGRAVVAFAKKCGVISSEKCSFLAPDGVHEAFIQQQNAKINVKLSMRNVDGCSIHEYEDGVFLNTGTNHFVSFVPNVDMIDIKTDGAKIRYDKRFEQKGGTNCNFVTQKNQGVLKIRTYERGVEDETLSCGTGITASAIAYVQKNNLTLNKVTLNARGGTLNVYFSKDEQGNYINVCLEGEAKEVFCGNIELE